MEIKVESHHELEDILRAYGDLGALFAHTTPNMSEKERVDLVKQLIEGCITTYRDADLVVMLEALTRASANEFGPGRNAYLEELYWRLPTTERVQEGLRKPAFVKSRLHICGKLIRKWTANPTRNSDDAFRRLIAMGWPLHEKYQPRDGDTVVELNARGRIVSQEEVKGILDIVRAHLNGFTFDKGAERLSPDEIFRPWLAMLNVPEDLRKMLNVARARMGGPELAERDLIYANILDGLPDSALEAIRRIADPMRQTVGEVNEAFERLFRWLGDAYPRFQARQYLKKKMAFKGCAWVAITIGPVGEPDEVFAAMVRIIETMRQEKRLCDVAITLEVHDQSHPFHQTAKTWVRVRK